MRSNSITPTISIDVYENEQLLETRTCRTTRLSGETLGVLWRGLAYPVFKGNRIDIAGSAFVPGTTPADQSPRQLPGRFAIIEGADDAYLLIEGSVLDCEQAAARLAAAGVRVIRTGRYLGDPVDDLLADWFVRLEIGPAGSGSLTQRVGTILDEVLSPAGTGGSAAELRLRLVESELASAKAREAALRSEVARLTWNLAERHASDVAQEGRARAEFDVLQQALIEEARSRATAEAMVLEAAQQPRAAPSARLKDEITGVFESLLPRIRLLRSSLDVVAAEYSDRRFLYVALAELTGKVDGMPANWKKLKGPGDWLERHISNGLDDAGRIYARLNREDRVWDVLVSHKSEQSRDIAWLRTRT
ncbi:hypothetical protein [Azospirillum largimobile]